MLKILLTIMMSLNILYATQNCTKDMSGMFSSFYQAKELQRLGSKDKALLGYKQSKTSAYNALLSCQNTAEYDYEIMYSFILENEKSINSLY